MAVLSDNDRAIVNKDFQEQCSAEKQAFGVLTKHDVRAAVNAIDTWLNDNAAAANAAIPQPARAQLTTVQKAILLTRVVHRRYIAGS